MNSIELPKFWCHLCKKEFASSTVEGFEVECNFCRNTFCEMLESNEPHPSTFGAIVTASSAAPRQSSPRRPTNRNNGRGIRTAMYLFNAGGRGIRATTNLIGGNDLSLDTTNMLANLLGPALGLNLEANEGFQSLEQVLQYISEHDPKYSFYETYQ